MHLYDENRRNQILVWFRSALSTMNVERCANLMDHGRVVGLRHNDFAAVAADVRGWGMAEFDAFCEELD